MDEITKPRVRSIATGKEMVAKQMQAEAGDLLPAHSASVESILFIHEGECILHMQGDEIRLQAGVGHVIPPKTRHQIRVVADFKGLHIMPKDIRFEYFD